MMSAVVFCRLRRVGLMLKMLCAVVFVAFVVLVLCWPCVRGKVLPGQLNWKKHHGHNYQTRRREARDTKVPKDPSPKCGAWRGVHLVWIWHLQGEPTSCATRGRTGAKFYPTQPTLGPVSSWDGLEVVQGVQVGHRAAWFGGGRARPAPAPDCSVLFYSLGLCKTIC
jgi:hypothetical protein